MTTIDAITEADILGELLEQMDDLSPEAARSLLKLRFKKKTQATIGALLRKNSRGTISGEERIALERYLRVGKFLDLIQAKARVLLLEGGSLE